MLVETGFVVGIEPEAVWVETLQQSACSKCAVKSGCGQTVLNKFGNSVTKIKVMLRGRDPNLFAVGQTVKIGIEESAFIFGVVFLYWLPLVFMLLSLFIAKSMHLSEGASAVFVIGSLLLGAAAARFFTKNFKVQRKLEPQLME